MRSFACCLALLALAGASPLAANSVYVPLAVNYEAEGVQYVTRVWVSNRGTEERRFTARFISTDADGTADLGGGNATSVNAGRVVFMSSVVSDGETGILEVEGPGQFVVKAEMVGLVGSRRVGSTEIPVLTLPNSFPENEVVQMLPWERNAKLRTDFGLVNLSGDVTQCAIDLMDHLGGNLIPTALVTVPPLSQRLFVDVLGAIGFGGIADARAAVSCDKQFYPFLVQRDVVDGGIQFIRPSENLGNGFVAPGEAPEAGNCTPGAACFQREGVFHVPTRSKPVQRLEFTPPAGSYSKLRLEMDFRHGGWFPKRPNGLHNIFWLVRDGKNRDMFGYLNFWGPNSYGALFRHGFNQAQGDKPRLTTQGKLNPGGLYHVDMIYDTSSRVIEVVVSQVGGAEISRFRHTPNINRINFDPGETITIDMGFPEGANPNEPPTYGWEYINLLIEVSN